MTDTTGYEEQDAAGGAVSGAAAGTAILPGWGTAIGGVVGAGAGFVEGMGVGNRQSAQQAAQQQYQNDLTNYITGQNTASKAFGNQAYGIGQQQTAEVGKLGQAYGNIPQNVAQGQAATAQQYATAQGQALPSQAGRSGFGAIPSAQNAVNQNQALNTAYMNPITQAYEFRGGQQQAGMQTAQANNQYATAQSQLGSQLNNAQQLYTVGGLDRQLAFQQRYGADQLGAYGAANAGSNQMLLGQLLQTGVTGAGAYAANANRVSNGAGAFSPVSNASGLNANGVSLFAPFGSGAAAAAPAATGLIDDGTL
jgi:hypothetical protein